MQFTHGSTQKSYYYSYKGKSRTRTGRLRCDCERTASCHWQCQWLIIAATSATGQVWVSFPEYCAPEPDGLNRRRHICLDILMLTRRDNMVLPLVQSPSSSRQTQAACNSTSGPIITRRQQHGTHCDVYCNTSTTNAATGI